jgi:anaerobic magnesium-protoporphyrin IX monomethyl ester cyclase
LAKVVLLDSPSWKLFDPNSFLHLGILYLAGSLREAGHDVSVVDCHEITQWDAENGRLVIDHSKLEPCDVLGISATTANVHWGKMLAKAWPAKHKVLGGSHATYIARGPHQRFQLPGYFDGFDFLMVEECEDSFAAFCSGVDKGDVSNVPNLCWFNELGMLQRNPLGPLPDVNKIAPPAFDLWPHKFYDGVFAPGNKGMIAQTFYARGCPYGCKFCADARTKIREESFERIEHQAKQLASLGVTCVRIYDDVLTIKADRCKRIADIMCAHGLKFRGNTRVNLTDRGLFDYLAKRGCVELGFGCEHGSAKMLKLMDKGTTPEKNTEGIKMAQDAGMIAKAYLMLGFPGETLETVSELKEWIIATRPSACSWNFFQPYPGSDVWNHPDRYNVEIPDNAFDKFWQTGDELSEDLIYLDIKTITKPQLVQAHREISALIDSQIGHRDRRRQDNYHGEAVMM